MSTSACYSRSDVQTTWNKADHFSSQQFSSNMSLGSHKENGVTKVVMLVDRQSTMRSFSWSSKRSSTERHVEIKSQRSLKPEPPGCKQSTSTSSTHNSFSEDIVTLHPTSAVAKRIMYSKKIGRLCSPTAPSHGPQSCSKPLANQQADDHDERSTRRSTHSLSALKKRKSTNMSLSLDSQMSSISLDSGSSTTSSSTFYWSRSRTQSDSSKPAQEDSSSSRLTSARSSYKPDALRPDTRAHFQHRSVTTTWNQERLFRAVIAKINRKYYFLLHYINLRPPRHFMVGLFYALPWKDITFELLFQEVEKRWVESIYQRYRRTFITTCMLYGGTT